MHNNDGERPGSGRSVNTIMTGFTAAFTQMTGAKTNNSSAEHVKQQELIMNILNDSNGKLVNFI